MNYLAHCYFSEASQKSLLGNLMGDFVKGKAQVYHDPEISQGIALHRAKYTDSHPVVKRSKSRITVIRRRFSGIMVDVFYDHFLARNWVMYSDADFENQVSNWYRQLNLAMAINPPDRLLTVIKLMSAEDWLGSYINTDAISKTIDRISRRIRFPNTMHGGGVELLDNYASLENDFNEFFPELIHYVEEIKLKVKG